MIKHALEHPHTRTHTNTHIAYMQMLIFLLLLGGKDQKEAEKRTVSSEALSYTGMFASRIELFLGTWIYFCSRAGCPMPRFLTANRSTGRACWFPPAFRCLFTFHLVYPPHSQKEIFGGFSVPDRRISPGCPSGQKPHFTLTPGLWYISHYPRKLSLGPVCQSRT